MMRRLFLSTLFLLVIVSLLSAQGRKVIKAKPEKEKKKQTEEQLRLEKLNKIKRTKVQRQQLHNIGGAAVHVIKTKYMGFGFLYGKNLSPRLNWTAQFHYFSIPSDQLYFDPYYWQFVQRNRGSMLMLTVDMFYFLPVLQNEPNIAPYWSVGGGPVLGIQSDLSRSFPGSTLHAYSLGGFLAYTGPGVKYYLNTWFMNFNVSYQILRFPQYIFDRNNFDGFRFSVGFGKLF